MRSALATGVSEPTSYRETVHHAELAPDLDLTGFNKLADEVEDETVIGLAQQ